MAAEARLFLASTPDGRLLLGGPWAIAEVKGVGVNTQFDVPTDTSGIKILAENANRKSALIVNAGSTTCYLYFANPTDAGATGIPLLAGGAVPDNVTYGEWWACCANVDETTDLRVAEVSTQ